MVTSVLEFSAHPPAFILEEKQSNGIRQLMDNYVVQFM